MEIKSDGQIFLTKENSYFGVQDRILTCNPKSGICQSSVHPNLCPLHNGKIQISSMIKENEEGDYLEIKTPHPELFNCFWKLIFQRKNGDFDDNNLDLWHVIAIFTHPIKGKEEILDQTYLSDVEYLKFYHSLQLFLTNKNKTTSIAFPIVAKVPSLFICQDRPLRKGEKPKRRGQTSIYEATDQLNSEFLQKILVGGQKFNITIKHDGQCSLIIRDNDNSIKIYRRYDIRKGKEIPNGALLPKKLSAEKADLSAEEADLSAEEADFCWIDVTDSTDPQDQYYQSAIEKDANGQILGIWSIVPNLMQTSFKTQFLKINDLPRYQTFELIGPKVQGNPYNLEIEKTQVTVNGSESTQVKEVPRHYFIQHGLFSISKDLNMIHLNLNSLRNYLIDNQYEGLVFHLEDGSLYKVNRFHINAQNNKENFAII